MLVPSHSLLVLKLCHDLSHWQSAFQSGPRRMEIAKLLKLRKTYRLMVKGSFRKDRPSRRNGAEISARCRRVGISQPNTVGRSSCQYWQAQIITSARGAKFVGARREICRARHEFVGARRT